VVPQSFQAQAPNSLSQPKEMIFKSFFLLEAQSHSLQAALTTSYVRGTGTVFDCPLAGHTSSVG
jgi:hypothetical protein